MTKILIRPATVRVLDMSKAIQPTRSKAGKRHPDHPDLSMNRKAIRNRSRRRGAITEKEFETLYKPIDEWDEEELARGRPRAKDGSFRGASPQWLTREVHEQVMDRFKSIIQTRMREQSVTAIAVVQRIMEEQGLDEKGRPIVSPATQLDAAKWLIEHLVGKPKQHVETDISVKLQAVLAHAMVGGAGAPGMGASSVLSAPPSLDAESWEEDDDVDDGGE